MKGWTEGSIETSNIETSTIETSPTETSTTKISITETSTTKTSTTGNWLAFDTSTAAMTIALVNGGAVLGESNIHADRNHSTILLPTVKQLMLSLDLKMGDLAGIVAGQGPGSYTGVRIGVTVAKTMAWALNIPLVGVSSIEALAYGGLQKEEQVGKGHRQGGTKWIIPLINARRNQVFTGIYASDGSKGSTGSTGSDGLFGNWRCIAADSIRLMGDWTDDLIELAQGRETSWGGIHLDQPDSVVFVGEVGPFGEFVDKLSKHVHCKVWAKGLEIHARDVGFLGLGLWSRGVRQDVHGFVPNYAQLTEAEKNLQGSQTGS